MFLQGADWILNLNPPRHSRIRSLLARAFTARRVAGLGSRGRPRGSRPVEVARDLACVFEHRRGVFRFDSPVQFTSRMGYDTAVGGVPVSRGTGVVTLLGAGNRERAPVLPRLTLRYPMAAPGSCG